MPTQFTIANCRLGYPQLWEPAAVKGTGDNNPRYTVNLHLPDGVEEQCKAAIKEVLQAQFPDPKKMPYIAVDWNGDPMTWFNKNHDTGRTSGGLRLPLVYGPAEWPSDPNAKGWILLTSAPGDRDRPPMVKKVNGMNVALNDQTERHLIYPGAEAHAGVGFYWYAKGETGVGCGINGLCFTLRDLGRFDSKPTVEDMFGDVPDSAASTQPAGDPFAQQSAPFDTSDGNSQLAADPFG
jgi:hypothetical protein